MAKISSHACYEVMLNYTCNARCMFCSQGNFDKARLGTFAQTARSIYLAKQQGYKRIGFTGGDPLVSPDILKAVTLAKKAGFPFIRVQTNGIRLGDMDFCEKLAAAGLTLCKFSFGSDIPAEHDRLFGVKGAFERSVSGLKRLRELKVRVSVNILITKLTYFRLADILRSFLAMGVRNFIIVYPLYIGSMYRNHEELGIPLEACTQPFSEASELMESIGLGGEILFLNVPACFLKGRESLSIGLNPFNTVVMDPDGNKTDLDDNSASDRNHVPGCEKCRLKDRCAGLQNSYIELFGDKVSPLSDSKEQETPNEQSCCKMPRNTEQGEAQISNRPQFMTENEECLFEILKDGKEKSTAEVLEAARHIALCKDCTDGNSVMNTGSKLEKQGYIVRRFEKGKYYWKLAVSSDQ